MRTLDNQYHLQAWRHFIALATESRCLQTVDVVTKQPVSMDVVVHLKDGSQLFNKTPCLLPELFTVQAVSVPGTLSNGSSSGAGTMTSEGIAGAGVGAGNSSLNVYFPTSFAVPEFASLISVPIIFVSRKQTGNGNSNGYSYASINTSAYDINPQRRTKVTKDDMENIEVGPNLSISSSLQRSKVFIKIKLEDLKHNL